MNNILAKTGTTGWLLQSIGSWNKSNTVDYNLYELRSAMRFSQYWGNNLNASSNFSSLATAKASLNDGQMWDNHSIEAILSYENATSGKAYFTPTYNQSVIDAGVVVQNANRNTDAIDNPIYGTPDIGAIEYQPPWDISTDVMCEAANVRVYGDGKFRYKSYCAGAAVSLNMNPISGWTAYGATDTRPRIVDINISTFTTNSVIFGQNYSVAQNMTFILSGLGSSDEYKVYVNGTENTSNTSDVAGVLYFTIGGLYEYSTITVTRTSGTTKTIFDEINESLVELITWITLLINVLVAVILIRLVKDGTMDMEDFKLWILQIGLADMVIAIFIIIFDAMKATL
jgi:hypothetical protein